VFSGFLLDGICRWNRNWNGHTRWERWRRSDCVSSVFGKVNFCEFCESECRICAWIYLVEMNEWVSVLEATNSTAAAWTLSHLRLGRVDQFLFPGKTAMITKYNKRVSFLLLPLLWISHWLGKWRRYWTVVLRQEWKQWQPNPEFDSTLGRRIGRDRKTKRSDQSGEKSKLPLTRNKKY